MSRREYTPAARVVALVLSLAVLHPNGALAQVNLGASNFAGGPVTTPILFPDGTASAPSISFTSNSNAGFYWVASNQIGVAINGVNTFRWTTNQIRLGVNTIGFGSGLTASDVIVGREGAAILQFGDDLNGAAIAQTIKGPDGITGTDRTGGNLTVGPGNGTGAGPVSALIVATPTVLGSGTTAQTSSTRLTVDSSGVVATVPITSSTNNMGWSIVAGANTACTTTCTSAAVHGWDGTTPVGPTDATADICLCAGAS